MVFFGGSEIRMIEEEKISLGVVCRCFCIQFGLSLWDFFYFYFFCFWFGVNLLDLSGYDEGIYRITWLFS